MCALPILTLPVELSITSGFNAIAHAAEALYAPNGNPLIDGLAEQGITAMCRALPLLRRQPVDASARSTRSTALGRAACVSVRTTWVCIINFATHSEEGSTSPPRS